MAYPLPAIALEQLVHQFLNNWHIGLQPCLRFDTKHDGTIVVNTEVICSWTAQNENEGFSLPSDCRKRSGHRSRLRRKALRKKERTEDESSINANTTQPDAEVGDVIATEDLHSQNFSLENTVLENEIRELRTKQDELSLEIQQKDSIIHELQTKVSNLENTLKKKALKQLSAVCVENTNVPPASSYVNRVR